MAKRARQPVESENIAKTRGSWLASVLNLIFAAVVAAAAVGQWRITSSQLSVMGRAIEQTDQVLEQMRLDQRPWLLPAYANVDFELEEVR